ncbi:hypothetical protein GTO91_12920 [Heliobacterium undosum]|uniref:Uncharacterized protein n=1 Tax=Heliomicrobium undosum TaxID=121734 RepID=A0A845L4I6_9FIRM|nr:hypothetical protein [Heliomicrobium undosum]MZP30616.1 hypothetical protein [Heliomicrobium undosum]
MKKAIVAAGAVFIALSVGTYVFANGTMIQDRFITENLPNQQIDLQSSDLSEYPSPDGTKRVVLQISQVDPISGHLMLVPEIRWSDGAKQRLDISFLDMNEERERQPHAIWLSDDKVLLGGKLIFDTRTKETVSITDRLSDLEGATAWTYRVNPSKNKLALIGKYPNSAKKVIRVIDLNTMSAADVYQYNEAKMEPQGVVPALAWDEHDRIYFDTFQGEKPVVLQLEKGNVRLFKENAATPQGSPDGKYLAVFPTSNYYSKKDTASPETKIIDLHTGKEVGSASFLGRTIWSKDNAYIGVQGMNEMKVWKVKPDGTLDTKLEKTVLPDNLTSVFFDGHFLKYNTVENTGKDVKRNAVSIPLN